VIGLRFFAGLTSTEVGKILVKNSGAVREMQSATVKSLRKLMYEDSQLKVGHSYLGLEQVKGMAQQ